MSWMQSLFGGAATASPVAEQARAALAKGAVVLDVRTPEEFAGGHIAGAKNISVQSLPQRVREVGPKTTPVVVYCRSGGRSAAAASMLRQHGYEVVDVGPMSAFPR